MALKRTRMKFYGKANQRLEANASALNKAAQREGNPILKKQLTDQASVLLVKSAAILAGKMMAAGELK